MENDTLNEQMKKYISMQYDNWGYANAVQLRNDSIENHNYNNWMFDIDLIFDVIKCYAAHGQQRCKIKFRKIWYDENALESIKDSLTELGFDVNLHSHYDSQTMRGYIYKPIFSISWEYVSSD